MRHVVGQQEWRSEHKQDECWEWNWKHGSEWRKNDWQSLIWLADVWWSEGLDVVYMLSPSFFFFLYFLTCLIICVYSVFKWEDMVRKQSSKYIILFIWKLKVVLQMQYIYDNIMCRSDQNHLDLLTLLCLKNQVFFIYFPAPFLLLSKRFIVILFFEILSINYVNILGFFCVREKVKISIKYCFFYNM